MQDNTIGGDQNIRKRNISYLARHHFSIDATDADASIKTGFVMRIYNITAKGLIRTNTTVVRTL
jgi:hypothetical protein